MIDMNSWRISFTGLLKRANGGPDKSIWILERMEIVLWRYQEHQAGRRDVGNKHLLLPLKHNDARQLGL